MLLLVKPQFELEKKDVPKGGVVKNKKSHEKAIKQVVESFTKEGFFLNNTLPSPIKGTKGNQEFFILES